MNELAKTRKKRSYTTEHSKELLEQALEALQKKTMSSYEAEKVFGIPRRTLLDKLHNKHPKNPGCPTKFTDEEEANIIKVLIAAADYGSPLTLLDLRIVVHRYLDANGRLSIFDNKLPGKKWAYAFIKRNKSRLTYRVVQNIKRARAEKNPVEIKQYFENLKSSLEGVASENIINYDETNLTDNPGVQKCLFRRGVKYPERVLNATKGAISIMFAITAGGECLPPYVVYKAEHLYEQWTLNGPKGTRFNRSKSGWFDSFLFEDWFKTVILPWAKNKTGTKVLIGDNLASHINYEIVTYCEKNDIRFVFLPPNSSHLTQPLDVCYFGPLKKIWREILLNYKIKNPREATIHKGHFPDLLKKLMEELNEKTHNIMSAFKSTGIAPFNPDKVLSKLPGSDQPTMPYTIDNSLLDWLKETRTADPNKKIRNKKLNVLPGQSVSTDDFKNSATQPTKKTKRVKKNERQKESNPTTLKSSLSLNNPDSLKKLCVTFVNAHLTQLVQRAEVSQEPKVSYLGEVSINDKANIPFIGELPECLQTNKSKINITSDITIPAAPSWKIQQTQKKISFTMKGAKITRSALHMKLATVKKETVKQRKVQKKIEPEIKEDLEEKKPNDKTRQKSKNKKETTKAKKVTKKHKSMKHSKKRSSSESSFTHSDTEIYTADTDDSEYGTMEEYIAVCLQEEQENIEPTIPYGISDIDYFTENDKYKLETDSWILAKFVTKNCVKHFVGKVISMKDNIPEVKFVRKVKESKFNTGSVFTYPRVDDICTMKHLDDDIILVLPEPTISRRGQIIFNIDLSKYNVQ